MAKIQLFIAQSLDGYIACTDGSIDWLPQVMDEKLAEFYTEFDKNIDTVVLGRKTYDQIQTVLSPNQWPYVGKKSYVCTKNDKFVDTEEISFGKLTKEKLIELKNQSQKNVWLVGGSAVTHDAIEWDLVDELVICTIPIILGEGIELFPKNSKFIPQNYTVTDIIATADAVQITYQKI